MFNGKIYMYSKAVCIPMLFCTGSVEVVERCVERKKARVNHKFAIPWQRQLHILHSCIGPEQACQFEDNLTNLRKETGAASRREEEKYAGVRLLGLRQFVARCSHCNHARALSLQSVGRRFSVGVRSIGQLVVQKCRSV